MLLGLDLSKGSLELQHDVREAYDAKLGLRVKSHRDTREYPFQTSSYFEEEGVYKGSLRQKLTFDYALLDIKEYYGYSLDEWFALDWVEINRLTTMVGKIVEEKNRLWQEAEEKKKEEDAKKPKGRK